MDTTNGRILEDTSAVQAELALLRAENAKLKANAANRAASRISFKVSEKGALSIYGLGRFPVTLYLTQVRTLDKAWPDVMAFVEANLGAFATKD